MIIAEKGKQLNIETVELLRAAEQCTSCHDCERGELLGAFSYVLDKSFH